MSDESITVRFDGDNNRFLAEVDGTQAGVCKYLDEGDVWVITHTVVDEAFEGRGIGSLLARAALDGAREQGKKVVPQCPFVAAYVGKHDDWNDILVPAA
ncbi:GNAT family N-acetyltransferase [Amnibacterium flavum]|uniref:N-acetyltransferase n=1 Tax=Amnibacterium flavum TaxID=2173173 RepID=A0A2V1HPZ1_9MICO|nr:GNAT family N-acetyltransferase [Amnibacterium flavum]PVZ94608.1 N-acetyltransferase [Amnibacterium flavum]